MSDKEYIPETEENQEKEIDLAEMASTLWKKKKKICLWCIIGFAIGVVVALSIPKEYSTSVKLAPELGDTKASSGGLSALASMAGFSAGSSTGSDAVYPMLYPDVVSSTPFLTGLFDVVVTTSDGESMTLQEFMAENKSPWWSAIFGLPGKAIGLFKGSTEETDSIGHTVDNFQLTTKESELVDALSKRISANVDNKTLVVTIDVKMQDAMVSAIVADTVVSRLQEYVTEYRTNKARKDLQYAEKLNDEAKDNYYKAQQTFADYVDRNQGVSLRSGQVIRDRLENEATLAFNLYNQTSQQVQKAQAKVQETTPVYAVITPATVPVKPSSPRKVMIVIGYTFLAFVICAFWILFITPKLEDRKKKNEH